METTTETRGIEIPQAGSWAIDAAHSTVSFVAKHMMVSKVRGSFKNVTGELHVADTIEGSSVEAVIDAASIDTGTEQRDAHLRSPDFLDVERFPELRFKSKQVERTGPTTLKVVGDLSIRDVTRPVVLDVEYEGQVPNMHGGLRAAFSATTEIDRDAFGITWNMALETGGVLVGKRVKIELEIAAVQMAAEQAA